MFGRGGREGMELPVSLLRFEECDTRLDLGRVDGRDQRKYALVASLPLSMSDGRDA